MTSLTFDELIPEVGDTVILVRGGGRTLAAFQRDADGIVQMPMKASVSFADRVVPIDPETIIPRGKFVRMFKLSVGWTQAEWRKVQQRETESTA